MSQIYRYDAGLKIDVDYTLEQLTGRFQSVKDGLPELLKNATDHYERLGKRDPKLLQPESQQIVVAISSATRSLLVLDFGGANSSHFEKWKEWSSRTASAAADSLKIQGGHGNGGKAFMVRGSTQNSFLESVIGGRRSRIGFDAASDAKRFHPGDALEGKTPVIDLPVADPVSQLEKVLADFKLNISSLPPSCVSIFRERHSYTAVVLQGVRDWARARISSFPKIVNGLVDDLLVHDQSSISIESSRVWIVLDGRVLKVSPLQLPELPAMKNFENLPVHPIPESLEDPLTGNLVSMTGPNGYTGVLELSVTQFQLRQTKYSGRNKISVWNDRNSIGTWKLAELAGGAESGYIYGKLTAPILTAAVTAGADRASVADTPETRALFKWCSEIIKELVTQIRDARPTESTEKERDKATKALEQMRDLMRRYLESEEHSDESGDDEGPQGQAGKGRNQTRVVQYGETVDEIVLENGLPVITVAVGSKVRLKCQAFEKRESGDKPVKHYDREFHGGQGVVAVDAQGTLTALQSGEATIYAYSPTFGKASNEVIIRCIECSSVLALPPDRPLKQRERLEIPYEYFTAARSKGYSDVVVQAWIEPPEIAKIGRRGRLTAGTIPGKGRILFQYALDTAPYSIDFEIGDEVIEVAGKGGSHGSDIPLILICGQEAPGYEDRPSHERTQPGGDEYPTIIEDPVQFPNVVWINDCSRESMKVRDTRRSGTGKPCSITSKTFTEFLALKCFDVLKRLRVRQELKERAVIEREYIQQMVFAEQDCSSFIEAAYALASAIATDREE